MKRYIRTIIYTLMAFALYALAVVCLSSCSTTKHTEKTDETVKVKTETSEESQIIDKKVAEIEHLSDSVVEHYRELIIEDSTGKVVRHEREYSKDKFSGSRVANINNTDIKTTDTCYTAVTDTTRQREYKDKEVKTTEWYDPPWGWVLVGCLAVAIVITYYKIKQ